MDNERLNLAGRSRGPLAAGVLAAAPLVVAAAALIGAALGGGPSAGPSHQARVTPNLNCISIQTAGLNQLKLPACLGD